MNVGRVVLRFLPGSFLSSAASGGGTNDRNASPRRKGICGPKLSAIVMESSA